MSQILSELKEKLQKTLEHFQAQLATVRSGRAAPAMVEDLEVEAYEGTTLTLKELATITSPEPTMLLVQPWDASVVEKIAKALQNSELDLNPAVEGNVIRVPVPPLSEERRRELVKIVNQRLEEARQSIRNIRRNIMDQIERQKEDSEISEDDFFRLKKQIQEEVEKVNEEIKDLGDRKESELMRV